MGMAYYSGTSPTAGWDHTCRPGCTSCGTAVGADAGFWMVYRPRPIYYSQANRPDLWPDLWEPIKPDKRWRWFDVFRRWPDPALPRQDQAQAAAPARLLLHTSVVERRRWKRRRWLQRKE